MKGTPTDEMVRVWLASSEPRLVAWGGHYVLADKREALLPEVEAIVEQWTARLAVARFWDNDRHSALTILLDDIIQMNGRLSAESVEKLDSTLDSERVMLLMQMGWEDAGPQWKQLYERTDPSGFPSQNIAAQMLAKHPPAGFAASLARDVTVQAEIVVVSPNSGFQFGGGFASCCGGGMGGQKGNWPTIPRYVFTTSKTKIKGAKTLIEGADPVYVVRSEDMFHAFYPECRSSVQLNDGLRIHLLGAMADTPAMDLHPKLEFLFIDREDYRARVVGLVEEKQAAFAGMMNALAARGVMTEEERQGTALRMELTLHDARGKDAVDLPAIAFRPPVNWASQ